MKVLMNYANLTYYNSRDIQNKSAITVGNFNRIFSYEVRDIDEVFYKKNKHILDQPRGAGYWLWKPYFILKCLMGLNKDDFLFYCDAGANFIASIDPIMEVCKNHTPGLICFRGVPIDNINSLLPEDYECVQTKRDTYIIMGCDNADYWYKNYPLVASFSGWYKNDFTIAFLEEWLKYAQIAEAITDTPNRYGPNLPENKYHRHDQSIFSILRKKYDAPSFSDPSQWGYRIRDTQPIIPETIYHHRSRN